MKESLSPHCTFLRIQGQKEPGLSRVAMQSSKVQCNWTEFSQAIRHFDLSSFNLTLLHLTQSAMETKKRPTIEAKTHKEVGKKINRCVICTKWTISSTFPKDADRSRY